MIKKQRKYYHISNIRSVNIIGPHNEEVLSVIIGSLLGEGCCAQPLYIKNSFTTLINLPLNPNLITGFTDGYFFPFAVATFAVASNAREPMLV